MQLCPQNTKDFPKSDVTWEYWNNINGASEDDYDMFTCMVGECDINISYTTLETVGEGEYKTEATRTVQIESDNKIKEVYYCLDDDHIKTIIKTMYDHISHHE